MFLAIFIAKLIYLYYTIWRHGPCMPLNEDVGFAVVETSDGDYVICGIIRVMYSIVLKVDKTGEEKWHKIFDQTHPMLTSITYVNGKIFTLGTILWNKTTGGNAVWLVKIDEDGNVLWNKTYREHSEALGRTIAKATDQGCLIGAVVAVRSRHFDIWLLKVSEDGDVEWNVTYGSEGYDDVHAIIQAVDGGYIVLGVTEINEVEHTWLIKINESGAVEWNKTYAYGIAHSITQAWDNGYVLVGWTSQPEREEERARLWLAKVNESGVMEWNQTYGFGGGYSIVRAPNNNYVILGNVWSNETRSDVLLMKVDERGNVIWNNTYGGRGRDCGLSMIRDSNGDYVIVGETASFEGDGINILLMKVDDNGTLEWIKVYSGSRYKVPFVAYLCDCFGFMDVVGRVFNAGVSTVDAVGFKLGLIRPYHYYFFPLNNN